MARISNNSRRRVPPSRSPRCPRERMWKSKLLPSRMRVDRLSKRRMTHPAKPRSTGILPVGPAGVPPAGSAPTKDALLTLFRETGALLDGHFVLRSGLHSRQYFQCAILLQHTDVAAQVCAQLADKLRNFDCDTVISPALGGIIVGQEVGRSLGKRHIFVEKEEGKLMLRRGFKIDNGEKCVVVEDVVTRGGRAQETIDIVRANGGIVSAVGVIVDRSGSNKPDFGCPFVSLVEMNVENFAADNLPPDLAAIPAIKPGSK